METFHFGNDNVASHIDLFSSWHFNIGSLKHMKYRRHWLRPDRQHQHPKSRSLRIGANIPARPQSWLLFRLCFFLCFDLLLFFSFQIFLPTFHFQKKNRFSNFLLLFILLNKLAQPQSTTKWPIDRRDLSQSLGRCTAPPTSRLRSTTESPVSNR